MQAAPDGAINLEQTMMAGLVPTDGTQDDTVFLANLQHLISNVRLELLSAENRAIVQCMQVFQDETGNVGAMDEQSFLDMLIRERVPADKQVKYTEIYAVYATMQVSPAKFRYAVARFLKQKEEESYKLALNEAFTIQEVGMQVGRDKLFGYEDSKGYLHKRIFEIESDSSSQQVPEGDIRIEAIESIDEYRARKANPQEFEGVKCGIPHVDAVTNGAKPGELHFIGGYTGEGKTFCVINWAHYANTVQQKNVVCFTAEVIYKQWRQRVYLRHARNQRFGLPQGISANSFKAASLTPQEEKSYEEALKDFQTNQDYGRWALVQVPDRAGLDFIRNRCSAYNTLWKADGGVHGCFVDSLHLIGTGQAGGNVRNDQDRVLLNKLIKAAKQFALNFDKGRGVPFITPWHANRDSYTKALEAGEYTRRSWSEANEVENSADLIWWLLKMTNATDSHEILSGICKYRDGAANQKFSLYEDFDSSYIGAVPSGVVAAGSSGGVPQGGNPLFSVTNDNRGEGLF